MVPTHYPGFLLTVVFEEEIYQQFWGGKVWLLFFSSMSCGVGGETC